MWALCSHLFLIPSQRLSVEHVMEEMLVRGKQMGKLIFLSQCLHKDDFFLTLTAEKQEYPTHI